MATLVFEGRTARLTLERSAAQAEADPVVAGAPTRLRTIAELDLTEVVTR
jgi:hypothetical protein